MASRCHFRHVVTDQLGNAIQNAAIYVYQPGTTTAPLGTLYTAKTGGVAVTYPLITDADGQVEAWADTAQSVDVLVTDNTHTAYLATATSSPLTFTSFTVASEIRLSPEDSSSGVTYGSATGVIAAAATDGAATTVSRSDHAHAHGSSYLPDAHHAQSHGNGDHTTAFAAQQAGVTKTTVAYPTFSGSEGLLKCDATSAGFTVTLPAITTTAGNPGSTGRAYAIFRRDGTANTLTITAQGTDKIVKSDGTTVTSTTLAGASSLLVLMADTTDGAGNYLWVPIQ